VIKSPFRVALMRSIRGYHTHQRTDRVDATVRQSHNVGAASSVNSCATSAVLTFEVLYLYLLIMNSYGDADRTRISLGYKEIHPL